MKTYKLSENSRRNRKGVDPRLIEISNLAIQITTVDFGHGPDSGVRTATRQNELFKDGQSKADGYDRKSNHQIPDGEEYGRALDFYAYVNGASWQHHHLSQVACAFLQAASMLGYKVKWGGLWKSKSPKKVNGIGYGWDMPHIELLD